ncbi:MAG TPA: hypothetical protein V6C98_12090, partial [Thermosynechococcaceae cyanobacterium]
MQLKASVTAIAAIGLLFLGACSNGNQTTNSASSPAASAPTKTQPSSVVSPAAKAESGEKHGGQGGQVIESGLYHLELVTAKESTGTHID